jgi:hypothetical protein
MAAIGIVTAIRACGVAGSKVAKGMTKISYKGYRFPPEIIQQAIWLYVRFTLSFRDVEDLLAERGIMVSYETVRPTKRLATEPIKVRFPAKVKTCVSCPCQASSTLFTIRSERKPGK